MNSCRKALASSVSDCAAATVAATLRSVGAAKASATAWSWARSAANASLAPSRAKAPAKIRRIQIMTCGREIT